MQTDPDHRRPPCRHDDATRGHCPGSLWLCDSGMFVALRTEAGRALWQARHFAPCVLDQLHGPRPVAAYGTIRLAGTGAVEKCLDVVRPDDGVRATIGFGADGRIDLNQLARFLGEMTGLVTRWYDQSGHGRDATAEPATAPAIALGSTAHGVPTLVFAGEACRMAIPPDMAVRLDACSAFAFGRATSTQNASVFLQLGGPGTADPVILGGRLPGAPQVAARFDGAHAASGRYPTQSPRVAGVTMLSDRAHAVYDERGFTTLGRAPAAVAHGGIIGGCDLGVGGNVELVSAIVLDGAVFGPGDANHDAVRACQYGALGVRPQVQDVYVADGDSITEGVGATRGANYVRQMEALLARPWRIHNCGLSGDTLAGRNATYASLVAPLFNAQARRNVVSIFAGTNDLAMGYGAASLGEHLRAYCLRARATGFKVIAATVIPRSDLPAAGTRALAAHNAFLREHWRDFCDGLADVGADPDLARAEDRALFVDGLHPTSLGYAHIAPIMAEAVDALQWS